MAKLSKPIKREIVKSSWIKSIGYDPARQILEVKIIKNNSEYLVYQYLGVPSTAYATFMEAKSKGAFLNGVIKNKYNYIMVLQHTVADIDTFDYQLEDRALGILLWKHEQK